jgi:CheY-like chemotaxis protein
VVGENTDMAPAQERQKFLIVEDEAMIAMILEDYLADLGHDAPWQAGSISEALKLIEENRDIDAALLDVNIRGEAVLPVAEALKLRRIPFCFMTGYGAGAVTGHPDAPIVGKPFDMPTLRQAIGKLKFGPADPSVGPSGAKTG